MSDLDVPQNHDSLPGFPAPSEATRVFGHDAQTNFLIDLYRSGKMHHALLFDGPTGIGKASLAFLFARYLMRQMVLGVHPQVLHLTRPLDVKTGKHKTQLTIEETKRIGHFLSRTVAGKGYRIIIVDPVNDMNASAANAILKNLEEPTPRTLFMLISQSSGRLLPTIRSRCLLVKFKSLENDAMFDALDHIGIDTGNARDGYGDDTETMRQGVGRLIELAQGSPRIAAMLVQGGGLEIINAVDGILSASKFNGVTAGKIGEALNAREAEPLFDLVCEHLLNLISEAATKSALAGEGGAAALAETHADLSAKLSESNRFNLDKRQTILETLHTLHKLMMR
jgi:DNA polymerase III subunit delta'